MAPPLPRTVCPVLLDIGSSRAVTLPLLRRVVLPSLHDELRRIALQHSSRQGGAAAAAVESWVRPCGFSPERPLLQDESWSSAWEAYVDAVRRRGAVAAAGAAPPADPAAEPPLAGTLALPVTLPPAGPGATETMAMEFFRVDSFIPVHVQMYHVMRRVLTLRNMWDAVAVAVVTPPHQTAYFAEAARRMREEAKACTFLVYDPSGLRARLP